MKEASLHEHICWVTNATTHQGRLVWITQAHRVSVTTEQALDALDAGHTPIGNTTMFAWDNPLFSPSIFAMSVLWQLPFFDI
jgi:hypothetical protein